MLTKRGVQGFGFALGVIAVLVIGVVALAWYNLSDGGSIFSQQRVAELSAEPQGFEQAFGQNSLVFLNYIFGKIPGALVNVTENSTSAAVVLIAMWVIFLLLFNDILYLFGGFRQEVNIMIALLLVIIAANVKFLGVIMVYSLAFVAAFGAFSAIFSVFFIFGLFIAFHVGGIQLRQWVALRRAQDHALRAIAGGKEAAAGVKVLGDIADQASKIKP